MVLYILMVRLFFKDKIIRLIISFVFLMILLCLGFVYQKIFDGDLNLFPFFIAYVVGDLVLTSAEEKGK